MYSIPETRKETRKDFQELIPTEDVIAISLHICDFPQPHCTLP
jgi:hypothetical protein